MWFSLGIVGLNQVKGHSVSLKSKIHLTKEVGDNILISESE